MPPEAPSFSVVLTTYNRSKLVLRALKSLLTQTLSDWELIIVDDGSEDATAQILKPYLEGDARIRYVYQENQGFINAKNKGARLAKGKYITFLDSDDEYAETHLEYRKKILEDSPEIDLLHGGVEIIGPAYVPDANNPSKKIHLKDCMISGTFFIKQKAMRQLKGFDGTALSTDFDFMKRAKALKLKIHKIDYPSYIYHRNSGSSITNDMMDSL